MQGPASLLNVLTIPPGAIPGQQRIVIDGIRGAIFEYASGAGIGITPADNPLVSSWASKAGTDPYTNAYPQGFSIGPGSVFEGTDFIIDSSGAFFYQGTPASGNLLISIAPMAGTDDFSNPYRQGLELHAVNGSNFTQALTFSTGDPDELTPLVFQEAIFNAGNPNRQMDFEILGPQTVGNPDFVSFQIFSGANNGSVGASLLIGYTSPANVFTGLFQAGPGNLLSTGAVFRFDNQTTEPSVSQSTTALLYGWDGQSKFLADDGNNYDTGRLSMATSANRLINSVAGITVFPFNFKSGTTYRIHAILEGLQGGTAVAQPVAGFAAGVTGGPTRLFYFFVADGTAQEFSNISNSGTTAFITSPAYAAARTFYMYIDGVITTGSSVSGGLVCSSATAAESWTLISGSFIDIMPLTG